jgi:flagellar biosynthesis anti-sigma factor FlgM
MKDMRINDQNGQGNAITPTNGTSSAGRANANGNATSASGSGSDSVQLSGFAGQLSKSLQAGSSNRSQRVSEIAQAVRSGTYQVDGAAVSRAMVDQAISMGKNSGVS